MASLAVAGLVLAGLCIRARSRHGIQIAVDVIVLAQCNMLASNTAAIVDAYDVSRAVDRSAAFSGLLIGIFMAANLTGAAFSTVLQCFRPHLWSTHARHAMFWPLLLCSCGPLLYCVPTGLIYTGRGQEWQEGLAALLLLSRILSGLGAGAASQVGLVCIAKGSPATEKSKHMVRFLFANMLGCGLGPLLAAFYHTVCPCQGPFGPQFWQLGVMKVILTLASAFSVAFCFPEKLQPPEREAAASAARGGGDLESSESSEDSSESPTSQHRAELARLARQRKVVVGCLAMTGLRGYLITALEGATALFLQKLWTREESDFMFLLTTFFERHAGNVRNASTSSGRPRQDYGWELHTIGFMVALTFLMCIPGKLIQGRLSKCLSEKAMIRLFSIVAILGAVLNLGTNEDPCQSCVLHRWCTTCPLFSSKTGWAKDLPERRLGAPGGRLPALSMYLPFGCHWPRSHDATPLASRFLQTHFVTRFACQGC